MSTSDDSVQHHCRNTIKNKIQDIFPVKVKVHGKKTQYEGSGTIDIQTDLLQQSLTCASAELISQSIGPVTEIKNHIHHMIDTSSDGVQNIINIMFWGSYFLILALVLIIFSAIYYPPDYVWIFLLVAVALIIIVGLALYFSAMAVSQSTVNNLVDDNNQIKKLLPQLGQALESAYDCFTECTTHDDTHNTSL